MAQAPKIDLVNKVDLPDVSKRFGRGARDRVDKPLPASALNKIATEFDCPSRDETVRIEVNNFISRDGGKSWEPNGGFIREPGPWIGRDGQPTTACGITYERQDAERKTVKLPDGTLLRSEVLVSNAVTGKLSHQIDTEAKATK